MYKYTVIYSTGYAELLIKHRRIQLKTKDNLVPQIHNIIQSKHINFIFEGWPLMVGETTEDVVDNP